MQTIAIIGLGNMGGPMAANLARAGFHTIGFDLSATSCEEAARTGVTIAPTAIDAVEQADVIITMLPAGKHVISVWGEILSSTKKDALIIDCSTIDIGSSRHVHTMAVEYKRLSLDAPVSGGTGGAKAGTLTFMVGGSERAFTQGEPILRKMGSKIIHCGEAGAGQAAKICNNMILGISMLAVSEAFVLAEKLGLSHQALFDVASTSSGQCWSLNTYCPVPGPVPTSPANNDYRPGFSAELMLKDLRLAQEAAISSGTTTPLGAEAAQLYALFNGLGRGKEDFSSVINMLREKN